MTQTSITSTSYESANGKAIGSVTYNEATFKKAGTISVSYGAYTMTFSTVTDYLIFIDEVIIPLTNTILGDPSTGISDTYVAMAAGVAGDNEITD